MYKVYGDYLLHCSDDTLAHYGVLGMHWGIRRYQNKDGTLTEAGRKRYAKAFGNDNKIDKAIAEMRNNKAYSAKFKELDDANRESQMASKELDDEMDRFYKSREYRKIADMMIKKISDKYGMDIDRAKYLYEYDDYDQGDHGSWEYFLDSNMPGAQRARELNDRDTEAKKRVWAASKSIVSDMLGKYGNTPVGKYADYGQTAASSLRNRLEKSWANVDSYIGYLPSIK